MRPASLIASAGMVGVSHVSVITITQQSWMFFCVDMVSSSSSILLGSDLAFVMKRLGNEGLCGCLLSLARNPDRQPLFCRRSRRRRRFLAGRVIHGDPGGLMSSGGMSCPVFVCFRMQLSCINCFGCILRKAVHTWHFVNSKLLRNQLKSSTWSA